MRPWLLSLHAILLLLFPTGCAQDQSDLGRLEYRHKQEQQRLFNRQEREWETLKSRHTAERGVYLPNDVYERLITSHQKERQSLQKEHLKEREALYTRQHEEVMLGLRVLTEVPTGEQR